jgi:hypothetical protein
MRKPTPSTQTNTFQHTFNARIVPKYSQLPRPSSSTYTSHVRALDKICIRDTQAAARNVAEISHGQSPPLAGRSNTHTSGGSAPASNDSAICQRAGTEPSAHGQLDVNASITQSVTKRFDACLQSRVEGARRGGLKHTGPWCLGELCCIHEFLHAQHVGVSALGLPGNDRYNRCCSLRLESRHHSSWCLSCCLIHRWRVFSLVRGGACRRSASRL